MPQKSQKTFDAGAKLCYDETIRQGGRKSSHGNRTGCNSGCPRGDSRRAGLQALQEAMRLTPRKGNGGHITAYFATVGSKEARDARV